MQPLPQNTATHIHTEGKGLESPPRLETLSRQLKIVLGLQGFNGKAIARRETENGITFGFLMPQEEATLRTATFRNMLAGYGVIVPGNVEVTQKGEFWGHRDNYVSMPLLELTIEKNKANPVAAQEKEAGLLKALGSYIAVQATEQKLEAEIHQTTQMHHLA